MAVSIQDVAKRAGVAIGTVSRAFHNYPDIRPETRRRIMEVARELGYSPNVSARNLSAKRPPNMGLIVSGLLESNGKDNSVFLLLQGVLSYAAEHHLELTVYTTDSVEQGQTSYMEFCSQHAIGGTIISGITTTDAYFSELMDSGIPTVAVDVPLNNSNVGWVSIDNRMAARDAVSYLFSRGCERLLVVGGKRNTAVHDDRLAGVRDAFREASMTISTENVVNADFSEELAYRRVHDWLGKHGDKPDGVFCFSDIMALGAMRALREAGLRIPEDVSVVGFDGLYFGEMTVPPLTTVAQDMRGMGYEAAAMLQAMMDKRRSGGHLVLPYQLLERSSVRQAGEKKRQEA